jgi:GPH family glycoside/pentoside/hexuronide:cation symporter
MRNFVTYSNDVSSIGLHNRVLYSTGIVSHALKEAAMGVFVLLYYKQVLGLSGTLTGLAIGISIIWDGISDPLVGAWSDRLRSRIGRRHPLMIAAVIPMAAGFVMLYGPPGSVLSDQGQLFTWLLISILLVRTALTFFMVPYLALGAEITEDYHERTQLAAVRTNMAWIIGTLVSATALIFLFKEENGLDGRFLIDNYHFFGWVNALLVILFSVICIAGTWQYIPKLASGKGHADSNMLRDIFITFRNKNFLYMVMLDMAVGGIGSITATLLMVTYIYFWQLDAVQTSLLFAGPIILAALLSAVFSRSLNRLFEKQQILRLTCALTSINLLWLTPLKLFDLLPDNSTVVFALICFNWAIHMTMTIQRVITVHSMLADIVDEQELATGKRNEGIVFAAAFFSSKFMGAFGYMIAGPFLDVIGLQTGAQPGEVSSTVTWGLGLIMGPGLAIIMLLPVWMSFKVNMSHDRQLEVRQALSQRQQAAESGDAPPSAHQGEPSLPSSISKDATETPSGRSV